MGSPSGASVSAKLTKLLPFAYVLYKVSTLPSCGWSGSGTGVGAGAGPEHVRIKSVRKSLFSVQKEFNSIDFFFVFVVCVNQEVNIVSQRVETV